MSACLSTNHPSALSQINHNTHESDNLSLLSQSRGKSLIGARASRGFAAVSQWMFVDARWR